MIPTPLSTDYLLDLDAVYRATNLPRIRALVRRCHAAEKELKRRDAWGSTMPVKVSRCAFCVRPSIREVRGERVCANAFCYDKAIRWSNAVLELASGGETHAVTLAEARS